MADEIKNIDGLAEDVDETVETTETKEEKPNMNPDGTAAGPSKGFLETMKDKLFGIKTKTEEKEAVEENSEYGDEISPNFIAAAEKAKWSAEQIVEYASDKTNADLDSSIDILFKVEEKKEVKEEVKAEVEPEKKEAEVETIETLSETLKKTREELDNLKKGLGTVQEKTSQEEQIRQVNMANGMFDRFAESFPVFGKTEDLPRVPDGSGRLVPTDPAFKAREEVWNRAVRLSKADEKLSFKDALTESLEIYEGKNYKSRVKDDVIKAIKNKSEQVTPRKSRKNVVKTYESEDDRKRAVVDAAAEKAGVSK